MKELLKDSLYTGVGFAILTAEKLQKEWENIKDEMENQREESRKEGKKIVDQLFGELEDKRDDFVKEIGQRKDELVGKVEDRFDNIEEKVKETTEDIAEAVNIPTRKDIAKLTKSVDRLETKVTATKPAAKTRAKRVSTATKTTPAKK